MKKDDTRTFRAGDGHYEQGEGLQPVAHSLKHVMIAPAEVHGNQGVQLYLHNCQHGMLTHISLLCLNRILKQRLVSPPVWKSTLKW